MQVFKLLIKGIQKNALEFHEFEHLVEDYESGNIQVNGFRDDLLEVEVTVNTIEDVTVENVIEDVQLYLDDWKNKLSIQEALEI